MDINRETVNEWLAANRRGREWLAERCRVGVAAAGHWLNKKGEARPIPAEHQITIRRLMEEDAANAQAAPLHNLVLEFDDAAYGSIEAAALRSGVTIRQWASQTLNDAGKMDVNDILAAMPKEYDAPRHWLDLVGGIAAGAPILSDVPAAPIPSPREYGPDHYALRVFGRSMEPRVRDGATIVVQRLPDGHTPRQGNLVVYSDGHGLTLKELAYRKARAGEEGNSLGRVAVLRSLNPEFPEVQTMEGGRVEAVFVETL
jgi:SOS-response transcriptional repressor LexA